jgi:hypothetical protein
MATLDLRPLSLGELLDRTFTLYRGHFLLFLGISAIPQVFVLVIQLAQALVAPASNIFSKPESESGRSDAGVFRHGLRLHAALSCLLRCLS